MNRGEIRSRVIATLREEATPVYWTEDELHRHIDDGYDEIAELTGICIDTFTPTVAAGVNYVTLPDNTISIISCRDLNLGGTSAMTFPVDPVHWTVIDRADSYWIRRGESRPKVYAAFGLREVLIFPHYTAPGKLEFKLIVLPTPMDDDADVPVFPPEYHSALVEYVVFKCLVKDAVDGPRFGRARRHQAYYSEILNQIKAYGTLKHTNIKRAIYGEKLRTVELATGLP